MREQDEKRLLVYLCIGFSVCVLLMLWDGAVMGPRHDAMWQRQDCVSDLWYAHEQARNEMPSIEQEQIWRKQCDAIVRGDSG